MRQDQIEALEFMLDDYGVEGVLNALADALERQANWLKARRVPSDLVERRGAQELAMERFHLQAEALRAQASALAAGRALTYATQAPLEIAMASIRTKRFK